MNIISGGSSSIFIIIVSYRLGTETMGSGLVEKDLMMLVHGWLNVRQL